MHKTFFKQKNSKYKNQSASFNGRVYNSKKEADYAVQLDWLKKAGEIKKIIPQYKISLDVNGVHIANYFIDFKIIYSDHHIEYHEVKGFETDMWRMKWKLAKALYTDYIFVLIK